jgi:heat shock protein HslJ
VQFDPQKKSISGFSGCNRLVGGYTSEGSSLHLNPMGMTMMACPETALSEHDFTSALESVTAYKIANGQLELLRDGKAIATFAPFTPPGH